MRSLVNILMFIVAILTSLTILMSNNGRVVDTVKGGDSCTWLEDDNCVPDVESCGTCERIEFAQHAKNNERYVFLYYEWICGNGAETYSDNLVGSYAGCGPADSGNWNFYECDEGPEFDCNQEGTCSRVCGWSLERGHYCVKSIAIGTDSARPNFPVGDNCSGPG